MPGSWALGLQHKVWGVRSRARELIQGFKDAGPMGKAGVT